MTLPTIIGLWSPAPGCGKSTVAGIITRDGGHRLEPFAGPLKRMLVSLLQDAGLSEAHALRLVWLDKQEPIGCLPGAVNTRRLQQTLGTEWGRDLIGPDLWVNIWKWRTLAPPAGPVVADDVRIPNEAAAVRELGGEVWQVLRPGVPLAGGHRSESGLGPDFVFDRTIVNDGSVLQLRERVLGGER